MEMNPCEVPEYRFEEQPNRRPKGKRKPHSFEPGLTEKEALAAARQCLGMVDCTACDVCQLLCPELCITRAQVSGQVQIDLDYCKGCGICASVCPKGAIRMVLEKNI
jgi:2-oxoacid:acceptor oxidoreductase delta subunit (pyruvate/2-ketoisovalerate family)